MATPHVRHPARLRCPRWWPSFAPKASPRCSTRVTCKHLSSEIVAKLPAAGVVVTGDPSRPAAKKIAAKKVAAKKVVAKKPGAKKVVAKKPKR